MSHSGHIIGIDLGTTNSVVAVVENDQPVVLTNSEGSTRTPSVVAFPDPQSPPVVGELAKRQALLNPERTVWSIKRLMGRSFKDVMELGTRFPFLLAEEDGQLLVRIGEGGYTPSQLSAFILQKMKKTAEDFYGEPVDKAVITVPAYFDDLQRQATYQAAELAGLQVVRLLNEPTAAAIAYGLGRGGEERVAVYDFGGGTFDLTILEISGNVFEVCTSVGDTWLGGDDIDALIVERLIQELKAKLGTDYVPDTLMLQRLREEAEKAKCELSLARQTTISLPFIGVLNGEPVHLEVSLRRAELEEMIRPLVERTLSCCERALDSAGLTVEQIDRVVLVGGSTRIPLVQHLVEDFFGLPPYKGINPDEIVAIGAAMQGAILQGQLKEVVLLDVTPHSLGIEIEGGKVSRIVERNSTIPIKAAKLFTTTEDNQEVVVIHVVQGESDKVNECRSLGKFVLTGIQQAKAGLPRIQVTFHINADGMVEVSAQDLATRQEKGITVAVAPGEEEPPQRRKRRGRRAASQPAGEDVVAASSLTQPGSPVSEIRVERQPSERFQRLRTVQESGLSPHTISPSKDEGKAASASLSEQTPSSDKTEVPEGETVILEVDLPDPRAIPCSPTTREFLEELRSKEIWDIPSSEDRHQRALVELEAVAKASSDKHGVWPWLAYLYALARRPEEAARRLIQWAHSSAPDRDTLPLWVQVFETKLGPHPLFSLAHAEWMARSGNVDGALEVLNEWVSGGDSDPDVRAFCISLLKKKVAGGGGEGIQLRLAQTLIDNKDYDEAISILERLTQSPRFKNEATRLLGLCCWRKGFPYLAWKKIQTLDLDESLQEILYDFAREAEEANQSTLAGEVYSHLVDRGKDYRDVKERLAQLRERQIQSPSAQKAEVAQLAAAFANSRFVILEEINRGSMGVIYRARDKVLDEIVALKILNDYLAADPTALERFKREARAAKRLSHPNIVRIHDMYEIGPKRLLSMEYIDGRDVKTLLREDGPLPCERVVHIAKGVCAALAYAHKMQIVHRDIKPANIMVTDDGQVKVTDFGIAKFLLQGADVTRSGSQVIGTPLYMAPEQIKGEEVSPATDLYALGVTMYEMLSGAPPFLEGNIEYHHLHTAPPPLLVPIPMELAEIVLRCLAKDPAKRFQSADEMLAALDEMDCSAL